MKTILCWMSVPCLLFLTGCGLDGPIPSKPKSEEPVVTKAAEPNAATEQPAGDTKTRARSSGNASNAAKGTAEPNPGMVREKTAVGMGEKGRGYGGDMITMPVKAMWTAKEKIVLDQMHHAMELYKASEGHAPKTEKEFMEKIIKENHLQLPTLPAGHRYVYDPSTEELMVERPNNL